MEVALKSRLEIAWTLSCDLMTFLLMIFVFLLSSPVISALLIGAAELFSFLGLTEINYYKYSVYFSWSGHLLALSLLIYLLNRDIDKLLSCLFLEIDNDYVRGSFDIHQSQDITVPVSLLEKIEIRGMDVKLEENLIENTCFCSKGDDLIMRLDKRMYFYMKSGQYFGLRGYTLFKDESLREFLNYLREKGVKVVYYHRS